MLAAGSDKENALRIRSRLAKSPSYVWKMSVLPYRAGLPLKYTTFAPHVQSFSFCGCKKDLLPENVILTDEGGKDLVLRRKTQVFQQRDPHLPCGGARVAFAQDDGLSNRLFVHLILRGISELT
jgi:hypothetical protein